MSFIRKCACRAVIAFRLCCKHMGCKQWSVSFKAALQGYNFSNETTHVFSGFWCPHKKTHFLTPMFNRTKTKQNTLPPLVNTLIGVNGFRPTKQSTSVFCANSSLHSFCQMTPLCSNPRLGHITLMCSPEWKEENSAQPTLQCTLQYT